jgi:hypothetical protein
MILNQLQKLVWYKMFMYNELKRTGEEVVVACFKALL